MRGFSTHPRPRPRTPRGRTTSDAHRAVVRAHLRGADREPAEGLHVGLLVGELRAGDDAGNPAEVDALCVPSKCASFLEALSRLYRRLR